MNFFYFFNYSLLTEYANLLVAFFWSFILSILLYFIVILLTYKQYNIEKVSAYECGFHPFEDTRQKFNIKFYLVSILFIIFDLEIVFLFPWAIFLKFMSNFGFFTMFIFLIILTFGFIYEWEKGALDWT